ncbi:hypothetical protein JDV02_003522 [Purpureocillium takamizusanense]|uniref:Zn(2)-C6 fungal-type domain-containing protein n=1 Tax=Purpureocillium takamizusanense TaxID=2060973 RepID=A0A9Q8QDY7_9HYPO|nr:uncharacterized protein JDV02_003522 [Purpureocillium takamizusanense]UNI17146.1 hypothetical protein JDV02_003522 [Purpureocillium takamizusanense]
MPPKKRTSATDADPSRRLDEQPSAAKRQRVSLACDGCRAAREKCDGTRPRCRACLSQNRPCSYTPASKKRGVQTGYLRAVELSLAWLLEQVPGTEETLNQLLSQNNNGPGGATIIINKDHISNRLHKRWTKSRVHKEIGRLLSDGSARAAEPSPEETGSDTEQDSPSWLKPAESAPTSAMYSTGLRERMPHLTSTGDVEEARHRPQLPYNWQRLIEIYIAYTHCWLPISSKNDLFAAAAEYDAYAVPHSSHEGESTVSRYAELWAALSVASFQDAQSRSASTNPDRTPTRILAIARSFLPPEDGPFDTSVIRATLLHALILIGRGSPFAASLLVGRAARILNHLQSTDSAILATSHSESLLDACVVFDAVTSACLRQSPQLAESTQDVRSFTTLSTETKSSESWTPVYGFGHGPFRSEAARAPKTYPVATLGQLRQLARILAGAADPRMDQTSNTTANTDDLVQCLRPQFSFCNSLISGGSTPMLPSAYLVKVMFLATTVRLVPAHRSSLLSNVLEVVEASLSNFGACGTPPLIGALLHLVQTSGTMDMHESERKRWTSTLSRLNAVWAQEAGDGSRVSHSPPAAAVPGPEFPNDAGDLPSFTQRRWNSERLGAGQGLPAEPIISPGYRLLPTDANGPINIPPPVTDYFASPPSRFRSLASEGHESGPLRERLADARQPGAVFSALGPLSQGIDYDAILEELGTIDYTDGIGMDPQFMVNLGFAPGCDLGEMFQGDFGG